MDHPEIQYRYERAFELLTQKRYLDSIKQLRKAIKAGNENPTLFYQNAKTHYFIAGLYSLSDMPEQRFIELEKIVDLFGNMTEEGINAQREINMIKEEADKKE